MRNSNFSDQMLTGSSAAPANANEIFERLKVVFKNTEFYVEYYSSSVVDTGRGLRFLDIPIIEIQKPCGYDTYDKIGILFYSGEHAVDIVSAFSNESAYSLLNGVIHSEIGDDDGCDIYSIKKVEWSENDSFDTIFGKIANGVCEAHTTIAKENMEFKFRKCNIKLYM
jgi:hypothetical protein